MNCMAWSKGRSTRGWWKPGATGIENRCAGITSPIQENPWKPVETLDITQEPVGTKVTRKECALFGISERPPHIT